MKKQIVYSIIVFLFTLNSNIISNAQEDMLQIDNQIFNNPQRPPVIFNHDKL